MLEPDVKHSIRQLVKYSVANKETVGHGLLKNSRIEGSLIYSPSGRARRNLRGFRHVKLAPL